MIPIRTRPLLEYFHSFIIRKHSCTGKFEGSMYVMLFRSYLSNQTTLRLRQRAGLFCTLWESSQRQQIWKKEEEKKTRQGRKWMTYSLTCLPSDDNLIELFFKQFFWTFYVFGSCFRTLAVGLVSDFLFWNRFCAARSFHSVLWRLICVGSVLFFSFFFPAVMVGKVKRW